MILDTNFLGALDDQDEGAKERATGFESRGLPTRIPTAAVFEAFYGIENAANPGDLQRRYEALLANKPRVELTDTIVGCAGSLALGLVANQLPEPIEQFPVDRRRNPLGTSL